METYPSSVGHTDEACRGLGVQPGSININSNAGGWILLIVLDGVSHYDTRLRADSRYGVFRPREMANEGAPGVSARP